MVNIDEVLAGREFGKFPISIGTSLALEGALGMYPDTPVVTPPPLLKYSHLWVNVATLFRNLFNTLPNEVKDAVTANELIEPLVAELSAIQGVVQEYVGQQVESVFYASDLGDLSRYFPKAVIKVPTTPKQHIYAGLLHHALTAVGEYLHDVDYRIFTGPIKGEGRVLLLSHHPIDLLSQYNYDELVLLESHTGAMKPRARWGGKLGAKDDSLPFNHFTLQVFGDGGVHFLAQPIRHRREVIELAKQDRWSPITTPDRIRMGLATIKDTAVRRDLLDLLENRSFLTRA